MSTSNQHLELVARVRLGLGGDFPFSGDSEALWKDATAALDRLVEQFDALLKVTEGLFQMIDRETWRATGGDDQQGHYEGDYRAAQIEEYLVGLRAPNPASRPPDNPSYVGPPDSPDRNPAKRQEDE